MIDINDFDIDHILASKNIHLEKYFKYFLDYTNYSDDNDLVPLYINLSKLKSSLKRFEKAKFKSFILEEKYRNIVKKLKNVMKLGIKLSVLIMDLILNLVLMMIKLKLL